MQKENGTKVSVVEINSNVFENIPRRKQESILNEILKTSVKNKNYFVDGEKIIANSNTIGKLGKGNTNFKRNIDKSIRKKLKANIIANLEIIIKNSVIYQLDNLDTKGHTFADIFDRRKCIIKYKDKKYEVMFEIGKKNGINTLYGIENIKTMQKNRLSLPKQTNSLQDTKSRVGSHKSAITITQNNKKVKKLFGISYKIFTVCSLLNHSNMRYNV